MATAVQTTQVEAARQLRRRIRNAERLRLTLVYAVLTVLALGMVYPYIFTIANALKSMGDFMVSPWTLLPQHPSFNGFVASWTVGKVQWFLWNSFLYAMIVVVAQLLFDSMAAYAFARLKFPGRDFIFMALLATMMIPGTCLLIPNYLIIWNMGWANTIWGIVVPGFAGAWGIFLLRQFFLNIPQELESAALIDGAGRLRIYWQIIVPLGKPAMIMLGVFLFIGQWNDFLWPLIVLNDWTKYPVTVGISLYQDQVNNYHWDYIFAAAIFASAPLVLLFTAAQRFIIGGIALTGLKG
jgi:multiple sugar transport system permease protein